jgi:hypothetical protein
VSGLRDRRRARASASWRPVGSISAADHHWAAIRAPWRLTADQIAADTLLRQQTERMAKILERCGTPVSAPDRAMSLVRPDGAGGFLVEDLDAYRNINLLPSVQKANRRKALRWLQAYLQQHPRSQYLRYYVITSGERCALDQVRARHAWLTKRMNRWRRRILAPKGIEVVAWSIELTIDADLRAHVHANVALIPPRLSQPDLEALYAETSAIFGTHWRDAGIVRNLKEFLKYTVKFTLSAARKVDRSEADLFSLLDVPVSETIDWETGEVTTSHPVKLLHHQLYRRRLWHPIGDFAAFVKANREAALKPVKIGEDWCLAPKMPVPERPKRNDSGVVENIVCAICAPRPFDEGGAPLPSAIIRNFAVDPDSQVARDRLDQLVELFSFYRDETPARLVAWEASFSDVAPLYCPQGHFNCAGEKGSGAGLGGSGVPPPEITPLVRSASG